MRQLRRLIPFAALVAVDQLSKVLAMASLSSSAAPHANVLPQLILRLNAVPTYLGHLFASGQGWLIVPATFAWSFFALTLIVVNAGALRRWVKVLLCVLAWSGGIVLGQAIFPAFVGTSSRPFILACLAAVSLVWATAWWISGRGLYSPAFLLLAAAGTSNLVSLCLPPFAIPDFLYAPLLGPYVFNLADMLGVVGVLLLLSALAQSLFRRVRTPIRGQTTKAAGEQVAAAEQAHPAGGLEVVG